MSLFCILHARSYIPFTVGDSIASWPGEVADKQTHCTVASFASSSSDRLTLWATTPQVRNSELSKSWATWTCAKKRREEEQNIMGKLFLFLFVFFFSVCSRRREQQEQEEESLELANQSPFNTLWARLCSSQHGHRHKIDYFAFYRLVRCNCRRQRVRIGNRQIE